MNLALNITATAKANVVVRIRGTIVQIRAKGTCIGSIVPITAP
jgi:hypothetical protein